MVANEQCNLQPLLLLQVETCLPADVDIHRVLQLCTGSGMSAFMHACVGTVWGDTCLGTVWVHLCGDCMGVHMCGDVCIHACMCGDVEMLQNEDLAW